MGEGTPAAAVLTERVHTWLSPQALLFVGVAGGLKDDIQVGDVVVATKVYGIYGPSSNRPARRHGAPRLNRPVIRPHRPSNASRHAGSML